MSRSSTAASAILKAVSTSHAIDDGGRSSFRNPALTASRMISWARKSLFVQFGVLGFIGVLFRVLLVV